MYLRDRIQLSLIFVLTLVLAFSVCPAEGFTLFEQHDVASPPWPQLKPALGQVVISLSGKWDVRPDDGATWEAGWIPSCFVAQDEAVVFRREFVLADSLRRYHFQLVIPELHYRVEVLVNGSLVASFTGSNIGFSTDVARNHLVYGAANEIVLKLESRLSPRSTLPVAPQLLHPERYGGVLSGIYLRGVPDWCIDDASLSLEPGMLDSSAVRTGVKVRIAQYAALPGVGGEAQPDREVRIVCAVRDSSGRRLCEARSERVERGTSESFLINVSLPRFAASLWSPERPTLYELHACLLAGADTLHEFSRLIGFKRVSVEGGRLWLNGRSLRIRGLDYVPESERGRRAMSASVLRSDMTRIKNLGMNAVRVPFGPPPTALVSLADEIGLLVLVDVGLDWVPPAVLGRVEYRQLIQHSAERLLDALHDRVSILAYGLGSHLDWKDPRTEEALRVCRMAMTREAGALCYVETFAPDRVQGLVDIVLAARDPATGKSVQAMQPVPPVPVIESRIGYPATTGSAHSSDEYSGIVRQAEYLVRQTLAMDADSLHSGYLLHAFADYHGHSPLTAQPRRVDPTLYTYGLLGFDRQERIAYFKLRDLAQTGQVSPPVPGEQRKSPPVVFPIAGLGAMLLVSLEIRRNNVFRQNLRRVFLHAHGFYSDLRYRRFLHTAQPMILWFMESLTLGLLISSILYAYRESFKFDYVLTHMFPWPKAKAELIGIIWQPTQLTAVMTLAMLFLLGLKMFLVRLISLLFKERVDLWQAANYVLWAYAGLLFLLPIAAILYRLLNEPRFAPFSLIAVGAVTVWCGTRVLAALRTAYRTTAVRVYGLMLVLIVVVFGGLILLADNSLGTFLYIPFFAREFSVL